MLCRSRLAVCSDEQAATGSGLGVQTMPEMRRYSVVAAIQTLWLAARAEQFKDLLTVLESEPRGTFETFWQSLARQIRNSGGLSQKQAVYAAKAMFGRENKGNREAYWTLIDALVVKYK